MYQAYTQIVKESLKKVNMLVCSHTGCIHLKCIQSERQTYLHSKLSGKRLKWWFTNRLS